MKTLTVLLQVYDLYISHLSFSISWLVVKGCLFVCLFLSCHGFDSFLSKAIFVVLNPVAECLNKSVYRTA